MAAEEYIRIKPNPLTNLTITSGNDTLVVSNMSTYYSLGLYYNETYPIVISADGFNSVTISDWSDWSNHTVSEEDDRLLTLKPSHLYAWDYEGTIIYTDSPTPSNGAYYYNNNGKRYEQYELVVGMYALFYCINSYNSVNDTINISGDPA